MHRAIGKYKIKYMLGAGGFGTVYLVEHNDSEFALKQLEIGIMNPEISKRFILESKRIERLRERYNLDYIIQIYDSELLDCFILSCYSVLICICIRNYE